MYFDENISRNVTQRGFLVFASSKLAHFYDKNKHRIAQYPFQNGTPSQKRLLSL
jgi:hypothetical protein